ncbi:ADP-ribosylglycohydrolase family protein [Halobaculum limi]|uniref:ADP-ribosylglycohydrolase family protein n=1 Tax=Halobaculum limi TaxID=3031916 RepID=UPI002405545E|nr:ADP-ribosylglycohydrolase family protein [Halobaculum sp. YSMS11]
MSDATDTDRRARARGALLGLACGDALGRPVEGATAAAVRDRHGRVTEMLGADGSRAGTPTAPTARAHETARRLLGGADTDDQNPTTGTGRPADVLAASVPYGLVAAATDRRVAAVAASGVGDTDPDATEVCVLLVTLVGALVDGDDVESARSTAQTVAVDRGAPVALRETLAVVGDRAAVTLDTSGGVAATLETALHEAVAADTLEEAVVSAVSRGGAASSLGSVAGAVSGARFGDAAVPRRWLNELRDVETLTERADSVAAASLPR